MEQLVDKDLFVVGAFAVAICGVVGDTYRRLLVFLEVPTVPVVLHPVQVFNLDSPVLKAKALLPLFNETFRQRQQALHQQEWGQQDHQAGGYPVALPPRRRAELLERVGDRLHHRG